MAKKKPASVPKAPAPQQQPAKENMQATASSASLTPGKDRTYLYQCIFIFVTAFLVYANTIPNGFNMDDELYTHRAARLAERGFSAFPIIFVSHTFNDNVNAYDYRPITLLSFALQYKLLGESSQVGHFINILFYALTCFLLFILLNKWFKNAHPWLAFCIALIFAAHPLHTEVVASIKSRDELLSFMFFILMALAAWRLYETDNRWYMVLYPLLFVLAILSKKTAVPMAAVIPVAWYFFGNMPLRKAIIYFLPFIVGYAVLPLVNKTILVHEVRVLYEYENPFAGKGFPFAQRAATSFYVMIWYLALHIFPKQLAFYYGYKYVPVVGWDNIFVWLSVFIHGGIAYYILKNFRNKAMYIPVFGAMIYLGNMILYSNLISLAPGVMAERFTYASSLGFVIVLSWYLFKLFKTDISALRYKQLNGALVAVVLLITISFSARSMVRNKDWYNRLTLYSHDMEYLTESAKVNTLHAEVIMGLANAYKDEARRYYKRNDKRAAQYYYDSSRYYQEIAKTDLKRVLAITPQLVSAINNLSVILFQQDSLQQSEAYLTTTLHTLSATQVLEANQNDVSRLHHNLGVIYVRYNRIDSALKQFQRSVYFDSAYIDGYRDLSEMYLRVFDTAKAEAVLMTATRKLPRLAQPYMELANLSMYRKDTLAAVAYCAKAVTLQPVDLQMLDFLRNYYRSKGDMGKANYYNKQFDEEKATRIQMMQQ